jgi:tRNA threonylcarbamoyladenosine biosynthesis protein TsaE
MKITFSQNEIKKIVQEHLVPKLGKCKIFAFSGPLGAGKTTLIKEFLHACGVTDIVTSPTFTYVNIYKTKDGKKFNHFDLYRMTDEQSFFDSGFDEYLYEKNSWSLIEWPEVIESFLISVGVDDKICRVFLNYDQANLDCRIIEF